MQTAIKPRTRKDVKSLILGYSGSSNHWLVYDTLVEMSDVEGKDELECSRDALGSMLNISRQTVSRSLKVLEEIGAITTNSKNTYIKVIIK